jgi:hypothetical protein
VALTPVAGTDDGLVRSAWSVTWKPTSAASAVTSGSTLTTPAHLYQSGQYRITVGLIRFDTGSVLPDGAAISSATLKLYVTDYTGARTFGAEYYAASNWPIDAADWTNTPANDAHAGTAVNTLTRNQYNSFALQDLASISTTAHTALRVHFIEAAAPASDSSLTWNGREATSNAPVLEVCYGAGGGGARFLSLRRPRFLWPSGAHISLGRLQGLRDFPHSEEFLSSLRIFPQSVVRESLAPFSELTKEVYGTAIAAP